MRRDSLMVLMMMVLAGLSACQQQEKAKPTDTGQAMEQPVPPAKESAVKKQEGSEAGMEKSAAEPAAPAQVQTAASAKETTAAAMPVAVAAGDAEKGAKIAKGKCGACHFMDQDKGKVGPTLKGIYNRAPTIEGVAFAKWDEAALDAWLTDPKAVKPKTKMAFKGIPEKEKRDDLIAYLKTL